MKASYLSGSMAKQHTQSGDTIKTGKRKYKKHNALKFLLPLSDQTGPTTTETVFQTAGSREYLFLLGAHKTSHALASLALALLDFGFSLLLFEKCTQAGLAFFVHTRCVARHRREPCCTFRGHLISISIRR
jgi:hypothetical protein